MSIERLNFVAGDLNPNMTGPIMELATALRTRTFRHDGTDFMLQPFEGLRMPARQYHLLTVAKTTKARPWQSAHQYGLAVDFACRAIDQHGLVSGWHWPEADEIWTFLKRQAISAGLDVPIPWDRGHVEHPSWKRIKEAIW